MTSSSVQLLAGLLLISTAANFAVKAQSDVYACVSNLAPCTSFTGSSSKPPQTCCGPLKTAITTQLDCLCKLYNTPGLLQSFKVNLTQALIMAVRCGIEGVSLSECSSSKASSSGRYVKLKLVHIDSPASGHRTIYDSLQHRDQVWAERSRARFRQIYHEAVAAKENEYHPFYRPDLKVDPTGIFLASFGVGIPTKPQLLALDTGSTLTWVTCVYSRFQAGDYDYRESRTSLVFGCLDPECQNFPVRHLCTEWADCLLEFRYGSTNSIKGLLVKDTITFWGGLDGDTPNRTVPNINFGCAFVREAPIHPKYTGTGILGLSNHPASMVFQFGTSFSYCIGSVHDPDYKHNVLYLGDKRLLIGVSTPILDDVPGKNYVKLTSIKVGGDVLAIDPILFDKDISNGGTIMDSGSAITYLADDAFKALWDKLRAKMYPADDRFCFEFLEPENVPEVQFIFEGGVKLIVGMDGLFGPADDTVQCFNGIKSASMSDLGGARNLTVIGMNAQQHHSIGFDYRARRMYIAQVSCEMV